MVDRLIGASGILDFWEYDEVRQHLHVKLWRALPKFDPSRGSRLFSYMTCVLQRQIITLKKISVARSANVHISLDDPDNAHLEFEAAREAD